MIYDDLTNEYGLKVTFLTDEERGEWIDYARSLDPVFEELIGEDVFAEYMDAVAEAKQMLAEGKAYTLEPLDLLPQYLN
jgi:hypothetical protein